MITPALSLESILAAMACLCSSSDNGANNFYTSLGSQINMKYPNESIAIVKPNEITEIKERLQQLEATLAEFKKMQFNILDAINSRANTYNVLDECPANVKSSVVDLRYSSSINVLCEEAQGNQWIVIQHRKDGTVDFNQQWESYEQGFGTLNGEFFIGLEKLHTLTSARRHELLVVLEDVAKKETHAQYDRFLIGNKTEKYALKAIGEYTGDAFDFFSGATDRKFSTIDRDNDDVAGENCAMTFGAWWHSSCSSSLNGRYNPGNYLDRFGRGISWSRAKPAPETNVRTVKIMIRPNVKK